MTTMAKPRKRRMRTTRRQVLSVACPTCKAAVRKPCVSQRGSEQSKKAAPHIERIEAARSFVTRMREVRTVLGSKAMGMTTGELTQLIEGLERFSGISTVAAFAYRPDVERVLAFARMTQAMAEERGQGGII